MVKAHDVFGDAPNPDAKAKEVKTWLNSKGVRDFEPVSLFCDQLGKVRLFSQSKIYVLITAVRRLPSRRSKRLRIASRRASPPRTSRRRSSRAFLARPSSSRPMPSTVCTTSILHSATA